MATTALGPTLAGGMQPIVEEGYELLYYPDVNNDSLQREGKPPVFYWLPNYVHLARKNGQEDADLMFNLIRFAGIQTSETTVGIASPEDNREVAGGVLSFTATAAPPDRVLQASQQKIIAKFQGKVDFFWGIRSNVTPVFRPVIILSNITAISNLSPSADGSVPVPVSGPAAGGSNGSAGSGTPSAGPGPRSNGALHYEQVAVPPMITKQGFSTKSIGRKRGSTDGLDPWYWNMQGQGNGSIDPMGQNAYSALVGLYPTSILWSAFHGSYSPIFVQQALKLKFWVPVIEISIRGNWDKVNTHFSAHAKGRYLWFSADVKAEFNNMRINGDIEVDVKVDSTLPGGDQIAKYVDEKTNLVFEKFMEQAKKVIFDAPTPQVEAAQASTSNFGIWGAGLALKYRRDSTNLTLNYHEKRQMSYLQDHTISSSMEGLYDEIQRNPEAEKKYFQTIYLEDWPRKLGRIFKPIVNWPKTELVGSGEPVAFVSVQTGYPNTRGEIMWTGRTFQKSDPADASWSFTMTQKEMDAVENPPAEWKPDVTYVKRTIHMLEPLSPMESPYVRQQIQDNQLNLDPGPNGTASNDVAIEIRADEAGKVRLGPISLGVELENSKQIVEVTFQATNEDGSGLDQFEPVKFSWDHEDQEIPRFWSVFTTDPQVRSYFKYQVRVIVKGSLFTKGMEWVGPWKESLGNGPLMITVPTPEDAGVSIVRRYRGGREEVHEELVAMPLEHPQVGPPARSRSKGEEALKELAKGGEEVKIYPSKSKPPKESARSAMAPPAADRASAPGSKSGKKDESLNYSYWEEIP